MRTKDIRLNMRITGSMLGILGACWPKRIQFQNAWPKGLLLRRSNLLKASEKRIGVNWFIGKTLEWNELDRYDDLVKSMKSKGYVPIAVRIDAFVQVLRERGK
ncbi:MAG TPA: hypothetical protein ENI23_07320 [bacterium]|nr:hypothetical protein [bacterium]